MEISKKQLKQLNEINKKIKLHFEEEYYIFPNGLIYGKANNKIDEKTMIEYLLPMESICNLCPNEVIVIYPTKLSKIFSQSKDERKVKMSDIGEPIINGEILVPLWNDEYRMTIGKVVNLDKVNLNTFNSINNLFISGFSDYDIISDADYSTLYNKEIVEYRSDWFMILLNNKIFKTFTVHCKRNKISLKYKKIDEELRLFETVLKFTHVSTKTEEPFLDIMIRERGLY